MLLGERRGRKFNSPPKCYSNYFNDTNFRQLKKHSKRERERPLEDRGATKVEELGKEKGGEVEEEEEEEEGAGDVVEQPNECFFRTLHLLFWGGFEMGNQ